jgi:outer membrane lipoprotein SlyB
MNSVRIVSLLIIALLSSMLISGCASSLSGSAYSRSQARSAQEVQLGYVESVRDVQIEGTKSGIGTAAGAALGGVAAHSVGNGTVRTLATIGGVLLGGLAGAATEEGVTRQPGLEITVRLDSGRVLAVTQAADEPFYPGERVRIITAYDGTMRVAH